MRYGAAFPLASALLLGSASLPECANAQSDPNSSALNRLFLEQSDHTPLYSVQSFNSLTGVENFYGVTSQEASLAEEFFAGYNGNSANMLFTRFPSEPARAHLYGANIAGMTIPELDAIKGSISITSQGYVFSGHVNLSGVTSFAQAATRITAALNKNLPIGAVTTGSSIAPVSLSFTGSINTNILTVNSVKSGAIQIGSVITGAGVSPGVQISAQLSGTPGGAGQYILFLHGLSKNYTPIPTESLTESYGVLTVGNESSGTVAVGQEVSDAAPGVLPFTAIEANLSGSGTGSTWVVNKAQTVASESMTMTAAPLLVEYQSVVGRTENTDYFFIQQSQDFLYNSASLTYMRGTAPGRAAEALGLSKRDPGAFVSTPGLVVEPSCPSYVGDCVTTAEFMSNLVANENGAWSTFQDADFLTPPPGTQTALEAWAQSTDGTYSFLQNYTSTTPPIVDSMGASVSMDAGVERLSAATVPEPSTWAMVLLGFSGLGLMRYRPKAASWLSPRPTRSADRTSQDLGSIR